MEVKYLLENNILAPLKKTGGLEKGDIIRRVSRTKDQQGIFVTHDESNGLVLVNVIDMKGIKYEADAGILYPKKNDRLYVYNHSFGRNAISNSAREVLHRWPLYKKNPDLQNAMKTFMESSFSPEQILLLEKTNSLNSLFVPLQQKLKIGRFKVKLTRKQERNQKFKYHLEQLKKGEHITYVAFIPQSCTSDPLFYSLGTQPHESTAICLKSESFNFKPTMGGHIKCVEIDGDEKKFIVDAGSNFLGKGILAKVSTARLVSRALKQVFKEYSFSPVAGRDAFDTSQSY